MTPKLNQRGFAVLEAMLIVIILAIIGGTGYYVYHAKNQANKTLNTSSKDSSRPAVYKSSNGKLSIAGWGVEGSFNGSTRLWYKFKNFNNFLYVSSPQLESAMPGWVCAVGVMRYAATEKVKSETGINLGVASQYFSKHQYDAKIGDHYYIYAPPQTKCISASGKPLDNVRQPVVSELKEALASLKTN